MSITMPVRPKSPCIYVGCRELVDKPGLCVTHKKLKQKTCDIIRGSSASRGYGYRWRQARAAYLSEHPLCCLCSKQGLVSAANVVDHIIPHKGDKIYFWDQDNWQSLCAPCHNQKTATEDGGWGRVG